jgi:hypothetical protein
MGELEKRVKHTFSWIDHKRRFTLEPHSPARLLEALTERHRGVPGTKPLTSHFSHSTENSSPIHYRFIADSLPAATVTHLRSWQSVQTASNRPQSQRVRRNSIGEE